jgi:hypothetical protein
MTAVSKPNLLRLYLALGVLESTIVFCWLASIPSDSRNALLFGYSASRLALFAASGILAFLSGLLLVIASVSRSFLQRITSFVDSLQGMQRGFVVALSLALVLAGIILFLTPQDELGRLSAVIERIAPLVYLAAAIGLQTLILFFTWNGSRLHWADLTPWKSSFIAAGGILLCLCFLSVWINYTGVGLLPQKYGWHFPGTPLLFSQLFLAWLAALPFVLWDERIENWVSDLRPGSRLFNLDVIICIALWLAAFLIWWNEPLRKESYFTPTPTPPNFEYYPYSDAAFYDSTAQDILIGEGPNNTVVLRPLYIFFLAFLHMVGGQEYNAVIFFQVLFMAAMPAFAFLLGSRLGGRATGLLSALLIIIRERNAIALTDVIEVTHSKLLLSDVPTIALMLLAVYAFINWLQASRPQAYGGLIAGACFGLVVLVRSQAQLVLPVLIMGVIFSGGFQTRRAVTRAGIFLLGFVLVVMPWVWRNYQVSGKFTVENTGFYIRLFAGSYAEPTDVIDRLPDETLEEYNVRIRSQIVRYIMKHPIEVGTVYASYFIHNEIDALVYFPLSTRLYSLRSYVDHLPFWNDPRVHFDVRSGTMMLVTLVLMSLGLVSAVRRAKLPGVMPLLIHFAYSFSIVPARISGWRYILPVDWIPQLYYCIGLIELTTIAFLLVSKMPRSREEQPSVVSKTPGPSKIWIPAVIFLIIGLALPVFEASVPVRYPAMRDTQLVETHLYNGVQRANAETIPASALQNFLETEPGATVLYGRALYPAYYMEGKFWGDDSPNLLEASAHDRVQFTLTGPQDAFVYLPLTKPPSDFPHASDVMIVGCTHDTATQALLVQVDGTWLVSSVFDGLRCPAID